MHLWRRLCCTSRVARQPTSISGGLAMCTARAALHHARVQQVRAGAPPVTRLALGVLHYLRPLCLPLAISHCSFLLPWALLNTIALPLTVRLVLDRTSMSKASALASGHAAVCYLLLRALRSSRNHFLQGPRRASVSTRFAPKYPPRQPCRTGALRPAASPPRPHASRLPNK